MNRPNIVRLELLLLAAVTLLLAYKVLEGPPAPEGLVVQTDIEPGELRRTAIAASRAGRVAVEAVGSFGADVASSNKLAAYGWILRRDDRDVVWKMDSARASRDRATLAVVEDTVELQAGTYDVYFTSFGNERHRDFGIDFLDRLLGDDASWKNDADDWKMIVRSTDDGDFFEVLDSESSETLGPRGPGMIWSTAPMRGRESGEYVFEASQPVSVRLYAVGEIDDEQMDYGWIEDAATGRRIWEMRLDNTQPAGGWDVNRLFDGSVELPAGMYRAAFETDPRQNYHDWVGNPPYDPAGWGITMYTETPEAVARFDPWSDLTPFVKIDRVGDDERRSVQFRVNEPVQIAALGLGEIGEAGRYDYGWITNNQTQTRIWEMTAERALPAGGHNNGRELALLSLEPGSYTVTFETDDSHSYSSWRHGEPEHPERWGVSLFAVSPDVDSTAIDILEKTREDLSESGRPEMQQPPAAPNLPPIPGEVVVDLTRLGNEQRVSRTFSVSEPELLQLRGVGEISLSSRYDYGWIEDADSGEIVWEMTWQNTIPAGGDDRNRMFDGTLSLGEGEYVAHFRTDFSHAYGDFADESPRSPQAWGLLIVRPEHSPL